jgi:glycosyltransferase involved in cell wall biosynthesis
MKHGLTGTMVVKNEADKIYFAINSLKRICNEIIVVDTGSTDNTKEIANRMGCRVFEYKWDEHFGKVRNFSISKAKYSWVFYLDADEETTIMLNENVHDIIKSNDDTLFTFIIEDSRVPNASCGRPVRLFPAKYRFNESGKKMLHTGPPIYNNKQELEHYRIVDLPFIIQHKQQDKHPLEHPEKVLQRVAFDVQTYERHGHFFKYLSLAFINVGWELSNRLIRKKGYKDGMDGLKWILLRCSYKFLLYFFIGLKPKEK